MNDETGGFRRFQLTTTVVDADPMPSMACAQVLLRALDLGLARVPGVPGPSRDTEILEAAEQLLRDANAGDAAALRQRARRLGQVLEAEPERLGDQMSLWWF